MEVKEDEKELGQEGENSYLPPEEG